MAKQTRKVNSRGGRQRRISVRSVRKSPPDIRHLSRALMQYALEQAAAEAAAQAEAEDRQNQERQGA